MIMAAFRYSSQKIAAGLEGWDRFWFAPTVAASIGYVRVAIGIFSTIYAAAWLFDFYHWIQSEGKLNEPVTRFLIGDQIDGTGSLGRMSLFYFIDSGHFVTAYLLTTIFISIIMTAGLGGRWVAIMAWILNLGIVHRVPTLLGSGDLLITGVMGYLMIDPGKIRNLAKVGLADSESRISANIAIRLFQCHVIAWLAISFISHLAEPMWWNGSAVWWLAIGDRSPLFTADFLSDKPYLVNALTHGFIVLHLLLVMALSRGNRGLGIGLAVLFALSIWGLSGDFLYSFAVIVLTSGFWGNARVELDNVVQEF